MVKVNDTVFAGEPLILLNDDEIMARYAAAEAQAGMRERLRDEQKVTGKAHERRRAEDAVADAETAVFDAQAAVDKAAMAWRATGAPADNLTGARAALVRAQDELAKRQAQLRGIEAPLPTPNEAQTTSARGDLALARVNLEKLTIRAPIDGTVLQININPGELAAPSALQPLLPMANLATLNVRAELDERDIAEIKVGQTASVRAAAFPGREFAGTVASIAPLVEPSRLERTRLEQPRRRRCGGGRGEAHAARPTHGRHEGRRLFQPGARGQGVEELAPLAARAWRCMAGRFAPGDRAAHFFSISRASSAVSAEVGGNLSFQPNGRTASMIALECEVMPARLCSSGMRGSSAELQALRTMSICSAGSQRVVIAHITSARLEGSTSSSTTTTSRPM